MHLAQSPMALNDLKPCLSPDILGKIKQKTFRSSINNTDRVEWAKEPSYATVPLMYSYTVYIFKDLVRQMLTVSAEERITVEEALNHR